MSEKNASNLQGNIEKIISDTYGSDRVPEPISTQLKQLETLRSENKQLSREKKIKSALIGKKKQEKSDPAAIVAEVSGIKEKIKENKLQQKELLNSIVEFTQKKQPLQSKLPTRFILTEGRESGEEPDDITISGTESLPDQVLDQYVKNHPHSNLYQYGCWRKLINSVFNHQDISLVAKDRFGNIVGLLPLIHMKSHLFGNFAVSMPYFNYGGVLADTVKIEDKLIEAAAKLTQRYQLEHIELREVKGRTGLQTKTEKVTMIKELPDASDILETQLGTKLRAQVKRAVRESPKVYFGRIELLDCFYQVFSRNMRDLGTPVYSQFFFQEVLNAWPEQSHIVCVKLNNKPVAAAMLLGYRDTLEIPWASALKDTNRIGINMYMYWNILNFAIDMQYHYFDFGRSTVNAGTYHFKKQWGAIDVQNYWNYYLPNGRQLPQINPANPKYQLVISIWKRLPLWLTNTLGPGIIKSIP